MKYIIILIQLLSVGTTWGQNSNNSVALKDLLGRWFSTQDKNYKVVFTNKFKIDLYADQANDTGLYRVSGDSLIVTDKTDRSVFSYAILSLSKKYLTLLYLSGVIF